MPSSSLASLSIPLLAVAETNAGGLDGLSLVIRAVHLLAGMSLVGGLAYLRFVWVPTAADLGTDQADELFAKGRRRWSLAAALASLLLIVSGLVSFATKHGAVNAEGMELATTYHMAFGLKFLLALVLMFLAALLAGRTAAAEKLRRKLAFWLNLCLLIATVIVVLAGIMRQTPAVPASATPPAESALTDDTAASHPVHVRS